MSHIRTTPYGTFEVRYREGKKNCGATFKTLPEAEAFKVRIDGSNSPIVRRHEVPTLQEFAAEWLAGRTDLADTTLTLYCRLLDDHVIPAIGHLSLLDLRPRRLAEWQKGRLAAGAGPSSVGKAQTLLSQILDSAVLPHEYLEQNPVLALKRPAYKKRVHRWPTAGEVEQLRIWYRDRDDIGSATLISVLAYIGIRPQDALGLCWSDLTDRLAVVRKNVNGELIEGSKTGLGQRRRVYVAPSVLADLAEWRQVSGGEHLIFPNRKGLVWSKDDFDNWRSRKQARDGKEMRIKCFKLAAEDAGLGWDSRPYDLRHTAATLFCAAGWTPAETAHQLGHSIEVSTRTYQHLFDSDPTVARKSVENYIREARGIAVTSERELNGVTVR